MPRYDYRCKLCGTELEIVQRINDEPRTCCPFCGQEGLERLISSSSFTLKGDGWYADGYSSGVKDIGSGA